MSAPEICIALEADLLVDVTTGIPGPCWELVRHVHDWEDDHGVATNVMVVGEQSSLEAGALMTRLADMGLDRIRGVHIRGDVLPYVEGFGADLFLSSRMDLVEAAIAAGVPAACMTGVSLPERKGGLRLAFDGDAVLFSNASEKRYLEEGLKAFRRGEGDMVDVPLPDGPLMPFLEAVESMRRVLPPDAVKVALVTARQGHAAERAVRTLDAKGVTLDAVMFCGDTPKVDLLVPFGTHIFFDDSERHVLPASRVLPVGHVPWPADEQVSPQDVESLV